MKYGERICLVCGKEFEAAYPSQVTCSGQCREKRKKDIDRRLHVVRRSRIHGDLEWLNWRLEEELTKRRALERAAGSGKGRASIGNDSPQAEKPGGILAKAGKDAGKKSGKAGEKRRPDSSEEKKTYLHRCVVCGNSFRSKFSEHKYCSDECLMASSRHSLDECPF